MDKTSIRERVAKNWRQFRTESGLTQDAVAERIGLKANSVYKIESGDNMPSPSTLARAAGTFRRDLSEFYLENPTARPIQPPEDKQPPFGLKPQKDVDDDLLAEVTAFLAEKNRAQAQRDEKRLRERKLQERERRGPGRPRKS